MSDHVKAVNDVTQLLELDFLKFDLILNLCVNTLKVIFICLKKFCLLLVICSY